MCDNCVGSYNYSAAGPSVSTSNYGNEPKYEADPNAPPPSYEDVVFNVPDMYSQPGTTTQGSQSFFTNNVDFNRHTGRNNVYTITVDDVTYKSHAVANFLSNHSQSERMAPVHAGHYRSSIERSTPISIQSTNRQNQRTTLNENQCHHRGSTSSTNCCPTDTPVQDCLSATFVYTLFLSIYLVIVYIISIRRQ